MRNGSRVRVRVGLGSWLGHGLGSGLGLYFAAILRNFLQFYALRRCRTGMVVRLGVRVSG